MAEAGVHVHVVVPQSVSTSTANFPSTKISLLFVHSVADFLHDECCSLAHGLLFPALLAKGEEVVWFSS